MSGSDYHRGWRQHLSAFTGGDGALNSTVGRSAGAANRPGRVSVRRFGGRCGIVRQSDRQRADRFGRSRGRSRGQLSDDVRTSRRASRHSIGSRLPKDVSIVTPRTFYPNSTPRKSTVSNCGQYRIYHAKDRPVERLLLRSPITSGSRSMSIGCGAKALRRGSATFRPTASGASVSRWCGRCFRCDVERHLDEIRIDVEGGGFLYKQVRNMLGTLMNVGRKVTGTGVRCGGSRRRRSDQADPTVPSLAGCACSTGAFTRRNFLCPYPIWGETPGRGDRMNAEKTASTAQHLATSSPAGCRSCAKSTSVSTTADSNAHPLCHKAVIFLFSRRCLRKLSPFSKSQKVLGTINDRTASFCKRSNDFSIKKQ